MIFFLGMGRGYLVLKLGQKLIHYVINPSCVKTIKTTCCSFWNKNETKTQSLKCLNLSLNVIIDQWGCPITILSKHVLNLVNSLMKNLPVKSLYQGIPHMVKWQSTETPSVPLRPSSSCTADTHGDCAYIWYWCKMICTCKWGHLCFICTFNSIQNFMKCTSVFILSSHPLCPSLSHPTS